MPKAPPARCVALVVDDGVDQQEVPAAVVCAICGLAECTGCIDDIGKSGIVAIVPWEREATPFWKRLWATSRATVFEAEQFFGLLPDGPIGKPLAFAAVSEFVAVFSMAFSGAAVLAALRPSWVLGLLVNEPLRVIRFMTVLIPATAAVLVVAHAAHGLALDVGARFAGRKQHPRRALRFGLYAAGWDLTIGPLGALAELRKGGVATAVRLATGTEARGLPTRSTTAFLRQTYNLAGEEANRPMLAALIVIAAASLLGAASLVTLALVLWLF